MKIIIPMGGKGTRLKPHTHTRPKPLVHVAGKPVLGHILDKFKNLNVEEIIFITGAFSDQVETYVRNNYSFKTRFIPQKEALGVAHAIGLAKEFIDGDVLIVFADTLFEADMSVINQLTSTPSRPVKGFKGATPFSKKIDADGIIWVREVEDPRRFGVTFVQDGIISKIIEKPQTPVSNLAIIGLYYLSNGKKLMECIDYIIKNDIRFKNEFFLTDALQVMINQGERLIPQPVTMWNDCGTIDAILETNQYLLKQNKPSVAKTHNSVIILPVFIEEGAEIVNSVIGPYVSIAAGASIKESIIKNSIINNNAIIHHAVLGGSLIGADSVVKETPKKLNMGDNSEIILHEEEPQDE